MNGASLGRRRGTSRGVRTVEAALHGLYVANTEGPRRGSGATQKGTRCKNKARNQRAPAAAWRCEQRGGKSTANWVPRPAAGRQAAPAARGARARRLRLPAANAVCGRAQICALLLPHAAAHIPAAPLTPRRARRRSRTQADAAIARQGGPLTTPSLTREQECTSRIAVMSQDDPSAGAVRMRKPYVATKVRVLYTVDAC